MVSFSGLDIFIIVSFFGLILATGFFAGRGSRKDAEGYLLSGRQMGLGLFILTNVATWYGGILGVGEFTYKYGIVSWFTQGFPYYIFAVLFAVLLAGKIRNSSLYTIPDKIENTYGKKAGMLSAGLIFILVTPAPYLLMVASILALIFNLNIYISLLIALILSVAYLFKGGFKSDLYTDAVEFFVMFAGFLIIIFIAATTFGGFEYLNENLPEAHLNLTGETSIAFIVVWFLIALWTFADPGFHQRCYAAKNDKVAKYGIIISVFLWAGFDFLTTSTGLFARAAMPEIDNPVLAFPLFAEKILGSGLKGLFYAGLFATILSTLNSFLFLSATTVGRDFIFKLSNDEDENKITGYTRVGLIATSIISFIIAASFESVIEIWYTIGSICIPGIIVLIISAYYPKLQVSKSTAVFEIIISVTGSGIWMLLRFIFPDNKMFLLVEPMIAGLTLAIIIHTIGIIRYQNNL